MFDNIGGKIKVLAKIIFGLGVLISFIAAFAKYDVLPALLVTLLGTLASWISTCCLYGFGQLIENSDILASQVRGQRLGSDPGPKE